MNSSKSFNTDVNENLETTLVSEDINLNIHEGIKFSDHLTNPSFKKDLRKVILSFAWPCTLELFLVSLISIVNLIMVGRLGAYAISAVGITTQPLFVSIAVFQALNTGATALVSRFTGEKDFKGLKSVTVQTMYMSLFSGVALSLLGILFSRPIVEGMGARSDIADCAALYMKYMSAGIIFQAIPASVSALLRGSGDSRSPMLFNITANLINIVLGYPLIYGCWPIPALGVEGAALAATIAKIVSCIISVYVILTSRLPVALTACNTLRPDLLMLKRIVRIGVGAAGEQVVLRTGLLVFAKIVVGLGTIPFAAHQICINILGLSFNFGQSLGVTAASFVGRNLGEGRFSMAEAYFKEIRRLGIWISSIIAIAFFFAGGKIASLYTSDPSVIILCALILKIVAFMIPPQTSQLIIAGGLRGAGDTKWPFISTMSGILGFRMILGFLFVRVFPWNLTGAWVAVIIDQLVRSLVIYARYKTGKWKYIKV